MTINTLPFEGIHGQKITYCIDGMTATCPITKNDDVYTLTVTYIPSTKIPEMKNFVDGYLKSLQEIQIFHENLLKIIKNDFIRDVEPTYLFLKLSHPATYGSRDVMMIAEVEVNVS